MRRRALPSMPTPLATPLLGALLLLASPVRAIDIVTNGHFDSDTAGWSESAGDVEAVWDPLDVDGSANSGSAEVTSTDSRLDTELGITQCLELPVEETFDFSGAIYVPSGQAETATVGYSLDWDGGEACDVGRILLEEVGDASVTDTWETMDESFIPPEGARSVVVIGRIAFGAKDQSDGAFTAHFDAIAFDTIALVPEPGATAGSAALCAALAGCAALKRRRPAPA